jgi:hypothetical protein
MAESNKAENREVQNLKLLLGLFVLVIFFVVIGRLFFAHRGLFWLLEIYGAMATATYVCGFLARTKKGEQLRRKLQYACEEFARHKGVIYGAVVISLGFAAVTVCFREGKWSYVLQFMLGGWPEGFQAKNEHFLLVFIGIFLQGFFSLGIPVIVLSILYVLLTRRETVKLIQYIKQRDLEIRLTVTDAISHRLKDLSSHSNPYREIGDIVKQAIVEAHKQWLDGQLEETKRELEEGITVAGDIGAKQNPGAGR